MIIPARSANCAVSGEYGVDRCRMTLLPLASIDWIGEISLLRTEPFRFRCRSSETLTAAAFRFEPSLNLIPLRILIV